ncbi:MAG: hypothetical protein HYU67_05270 [Flavobacteriia bacterium]|nr:hypothetical protein [Flavobacteriia bacterium]
MNLYFCFELKKTHYINVALINKKLFALISFFYFTHICAQFSNISLINSTSDAAKSVFAIDIHSDSDLEIISSLSNESTLAFID